MKFVNFNAIKPTQTAIQRVNSLMKTTNVVAKLNSIPSIVRNPTKLPSTTPIPKGRNEITPRMIEVT